MSLMSSDYCATPYEEYSGDDDDSGTKEYASYNAGRYQHHSVFVGSFPRLKIIYELVVSEFGFTVEC